MNNDQNNKKTIAEIEGISDEYWKNIDELRKEQDEVIQEYVSKLEEKKRGEIMKKFE